MENERILNSEQIISLGCAVDDEIQASGQSKTAVLHIDAIELVHMGQGGFIYRLLLSSPRHFQADQPLTLRTSRSYSYELIQASILSATDQEICIVCQRALPDDVRLLHAQFDPSFIFSALRDFIQAKNYAPPGLAHQLVRGMIPQAHAEAKVKRVQDLNDEQLAGLRKMLTGPMHFLWGPPGTGKTRTLGATIGVWFQKHKSVLVLSTSNAAVDIALKAAIPHIGAHEPVKVLRLGNTSDSELSDFTVAGRITKDCSTVVPGSHHITHVQQDLKNIGDTLTQLLIDYRQQRKKSDSAAEDLERLAMQKAKLEEELSQYSTTIEEHTQEILDESMVVGCTLAKMVLEKKLHNRQFDAVVVDESSMVPLAYALAASTLAKDVLVYAGDPYQLPPICSSDSSDARRWFGRNVYEPLDVEKECSTRKDAITLLKKQYRMTNQIGSFVSELTYHGSLEHARAQDGPQVEFIQLPEEWCRTYCDINAKPKSYYHPATIALIHEILPSLGSNKEEVLLLSPFRSQQALMRATVLDLASSQSISDTAVSCKTIHRAQGSEARAVIVDLTAHSPDSVPSFFREASSENLLNVALSRARNHLIILSNERFLDALIDDGGGSWDRLRRLLRDQANVRGAEEILPGGHPFGSIRSMIDHSNGDGSAKMPAIAAVGDHPDAGPFVDLLTHMRASSKLLVLSTNGSAPAEGNGPFAVRHDKRRQCPSLIAAGGYVFLPLRGEWVSVKSPNASRAIWRVGFSYLVDEEVNPADEAKFLCKVCHAGYLTVESDGDGWFLRCDNWPDCRHQRRLSLEEAKLKVRLNNRHCPKGHPSTARSGPSGLFIGCENYPSCDHRESLSILRGL